MQNMYEKEPLDGNQTCSWMIQTLQHLTPTLNFHSMSQKRRKGVTVITRYETESNWLKTCVNNVVIAERTKAWNVYKTIGNDHHDVQKSTLEQ